MPRFAANLSTMFQEHAFLDRFAAAARAGFTAVECQFPYEFAASDIRDRLTEQGLTLALFNLPPGDLAAGERGLACLPDRVGDFRATVDTALACAEALDCRKLHCMAGLVPRGADRAVLNDTFCSNLEFAASKARAAGCTLLIEPINARDVPDYFLHTTAEARAIIDAVGAPNLGLQLDLYHCQISEGDLAMHIRDCADITGHYQIAGVPGRHEPDIGEIAYPYLFDVIDETGYDGFIGCEYTPRANTETGLGWFAPWA